MNHKKPDITLKGKKKKSVWEKFLYQTSYNKITEQMQQNVYVWQNK
jgi:hypothetical protein